MATKVRRALSREGFNLTPMIDVVFQLMIFFLVATRLEDNQQYLQVTLPEASQAKPLIARPEELVVNIDLQGGFVVRGSRMDALGLEKLLQQLAADNPGRQQVMIRFDKQTPSQALVTVIDLCKKARISSYSFATLPKAEAQ